MIKHLGPRLVVATIVVLVTLTGGSMALADVRRADLAPDAGARALQLKVVTPAGMPRAGRDPGRNRQTSLREAARQPMGNGTRVNRPARTSTKDHQHDVTPGQVFTAPKSSHRLSSGCLTDYGVPGAQCLPAKAAGVKVTCIDVLKVFPHGVAVVGKDRLALDRNGDGVACGHGDF